MTVSKSLINAYKEEVKHNYIYKEPMKAYSYFALFQAIGNYLIFNPRTNKDDIKAFAAVATNLGHILPTCRTRPKPAQHRH